MTTRIDRDRDKLVVQDPDSLPGAIRDRHQEHKFTHAYPEGQAMNLGSTVLFGPKKAPPVQPVRVIERRPEDEIEAQVVEAGADELEDIAASEVQSWADEESDDEEIAQRTTWGRR